MSIEFACQTCQKRYEVDNRSAGQGMTCSQCGTRLIVPADSILRVAYALPPIRRSAGPAGAATVAVPAMGGGLCMVCHAGNPVGRSFCSRCGRALPAATPSGPRVVSGLDGPTTELGRSFLADQLHLEMNKACRALLTVAILTGIASMGAVRMMFLAAQAQRPHAHLYLKPIGYVPLMAETLAYWLLFGWSLRNPLPAAIVGLTLYVTMQVTVVVVSPLVLASIWFWLFRIFIIALLAQAIRGGVAYRRLMRQPLAEALA